MASIDGRKRPSLDQGLAGHPTQYNFFQAVRMLASKFSGDDQDVEAIDRNLIFSTETGDQFPATDIYNILEEDDKTNITLSTFALSGPSGPIPQLHSEWIYDEYRHGNPALKDFLGLFEHRLISLLYLAKRRSFVGLHNGERQASKQYRYLSDISGLRRESLSHSGKGINEDSGFSSLIPFSGLLAGGKTKAADLKNILSTILAVDVELNQSIGEFIKIDDSQCTYLSYSKRLAKRLGGSAALGKSVWNQNHAIQLKLGPVNFSKAQDWLPGAPQFDFLSELLLYVSNGQWVLKLDIEVIEDSIPRSVLAYTNPTNKGLKLGLNSWLKSQDGDAVSKQTRRIIKPKHLH